MSWGSGYDIASSIPPWSGQPWQQYNTNFPADLWLGAWGAPNVGVFIAFFGDWPGDTAFRWMWPHGFDTLSGHILVHYWDADLGDSFIIDEAAFRGHLLPIVLYQGVVGAFTPYL